MEAILKSAGAQTKVRIVLDHIAELFDRGELQPGSKMPSERKLATELKVSRNVVREAMVALQIAGKVEIRTGAGTFVSESQHSEDSEATKLSAGLEIADTLELRMSLEIAASALACLRARESDLLRMRSAITAMYKYAEDEEYEALLDSSMDLHVAVASAAHSAPLTQSLRHITEAVRGGEWILAENYTAQIAEKSLALHCQLVEAIAQRDIEAAVKAAVAHYENYPVIEGNFLTTPEDAAEHAGE